MQITGEMLIGGSAVRGTEATLEALNPATGAALGPEFGGGGAEEVDRACRLAAEAFPVYRETSFAVRAELLERIAQGLLDAGTALVERTVAESGLAQGRIEGERGRTVGQLRLFAAVVRDGRSVGAVLDSALPGRTPLARPDLRLRRIAVGPVAVFGASNFPLAFSVAGGDTASALAAGCPVVAKAHPAHLGTSELVGRVIQAAVREMGLPEGVFSLLIGAGNALGARLVEHPAIEAVAFTGSRAGGLALMKLAQARRQPIPVYAEMSSVNPVFLFPAALGTRGTAIAEGFAASLTLGAGQFCTNPGLVFGVEGAQLERFRRDAAAAVEKQSAATMLTPAIHAAYCVGVGSIAAAAGVRMIGSGIDGAGPCAAVASLFATDSATFAGNEALAAEVFGPAGLIVGCRTTGEFVELARQLEGQLTATLQIEPADYAAARELAAVLELKAGRILVNGFPTGVEVSYAMVHGGPFPATSDGRSSSVGASAIERFLRPVCYQNFPAELLPESLRDANPLGIDRLEDGRMCLGTRD